MLLWGQEANGETRMINRELTSETESIERLHAELGRAREEIAQLEAQLRELKAREAPPQRLVLESFEETLRSFAKSLLDSTETAFFSLLVQALGKALDVDYVLICEQSDPETARTLAYYADGQTASNFSYALEGSPCAAVMERGQCCITQGLRSLFPEDRDLLELQAEAYAGMALQDASGKHVGLLAVLDRKPFSCPETVESLLSLVAKPAASELMRRRSETETARRAQALEQAYAQLQDHSQRIEAEIAQRKRELLSEKALIDHIIASIPVGIVYLDRGLIVRWTNAEQLRITGLQPERFVNRSIFEIFETLDPADERFVEVLSHGQPAQLQGIPFEVGGALVHIDCTLTPIFEEDRTVRGILLFAMDVSARVENERLQQKQIQTLRELDRLKGDFINAASHELRTPLTSITGYAEFLEDEVAGALSTDQRGFVSQIQEGAKRLQRIVDDMLDFARLEAGSFKLVVREADLVQLVQEELSFVQPQAYEARVTIRTELPAGPLMVRMDPSRIGQVLLNLLGNAIKFTSANGEVTISLHVEETEVRLEVRDTGIGIAPEHVDRLFQKFFQVDASMTRERGGAGLGLSIAKALIQEHGGRIGVRSQPGAGSTFWFTLPLQHEFEEASPILD